MQLRYNRDKLKWFKAPIHIIRNIYSLTELWNSRNVFKY